MDKSGISIAAKRTDLVQLHSVCEKVLHLLEALSSAEENDKESAEEGAEKEEETEMKAKAGFVAGKKAEREEWKKGQLQL